MALTKVYPRMVTGIPISVMDFGAVSDGSGHDRTAGRTRRIGSWPCRFLAPGNRGECLREGSRRNGAHGGLRVSLLAARISRGLRGRDQHYLRPVPGPPRGPRGPNQSPACRVRYDAATSKRNRCRNSCRVDNTGSPRLQWRRCNTGHGLTKSERVYVHADHNRRRDRCCPGAC